MKNARYTVRLASTPGMWEQYEGDVCVWATGPDEAVSAAVAKVGRGDFPDRAYRGAWRVVSVQIERGN